MCVNLIFFYDNKTCRFLQSRYAIFKEFFQCCQNLIDYVLFRVCLSAHSYSMINSKVREITKNRCLDCYAIYVNIL